MRQLDEFVDAWVRSVGTSEPHLVPHLDEIADHVRSDARERIDSGFDVPSAFAAGDRATSPRPAIAAPPAIRPLPTERQTRQAVTAHIQQVELSRFLGPARGAFRGPGPDLCHLTRAGR